MGKTGPTKVDILQLINYRVMHGLGPVTTDEVAGKLGRDRAWTAVVMSRYARQGVLVAIKARGKPTKYGIGENAFGQMSGREWIRKFEKKDRAK